MSGVALEKRCQWQVGHCGNSIHTANRLAASASTVSLAMANALAMGGQDLVRASCNSPATGW